MKILRPLCFALLIMSSAISLAKLPLAKSIFVEIPAKTIVLKNPAAANINQYFASTTSVSFEIYKPGSKDELSKIVSSFKSNKLVTSCSEGILTGDYQAISITLSSAQDKAFFIALFKAAGLNTIRVNANPIIEVDKL